MRRRAETVEAKRFAFASHDEGSPADQPGAEQRREFLIRPMFAERKRIMRVGNRVCGVATVARIAREDGIIAEIFVARQAKWAMAAGMAEPRNADALAKVKMCDIGADRIDPSDDLMSRNNRQFRIGQFAIDDMEIGAADAASADTNANFAAARHAGPVVLHRQAVHRFCGEP